MIISNHHNKNNSSILPRNSPKYVSPVSKNSLTTNSKNINSLTTIKHPIYDLDIMSDEDISSINLSFDSSLDSYDNSLDSYDSSLDSYDANKILWSSQSISTLTDLMNTINNSKLMKPIGHIVRYYLDKHQPYNQEYKMHTVDPNHSINKNILILANIIEIHINDSDIIITDNMIYKSMGKIILEVIIDKFMYESWSLKYEEVFLINLMSDVLQQNREIITTSYYIIKYFIKYTTYSHDNILDTIPTTLTRAHEIDTSMFTHSQIRDILNVLKTKRKLYFRLLLVITEYLLHEKQDRITPILLNVTDTNNLEEFKLLINDIMLQTIISTTGFILKMNN